MSRSRRARRSPIPRLGRQGGFQGWPCDVQRDGISGIEWPTDQMVRQCGLWRRRGPQHGTHDRVDPADDSCVLPSAAAQMLVSVEATEELVDSAVFTVSRLGSTTRPLTVYFGLTGTASIGEDYTASGIGSVTIPAGESSASVTVTPTSCLCNIDDLTIVFSIVLSDIGGYDIDLDNYFAMATLTSCGFTTVVAYGATGNGTTDDTANIQAAITAQAAAGGGDVLFPPGSYLVSQITVPSDVRLIGQGGAELISKNTSGTPLVSLEGSVSATSATLTANGTLGATSVSIADSTAFAVDDYVLVRDDTYFNTIDTAGRNQQILRIKSKAATTLTFYTPLNSTFETAQSAQVVVISPVLNSRVEGLYFTIPDGFKGGAVYASLAIDCEVVDCHGRGCREWPTFRLDTCLHSGFRRSSARDAYDPTDSAGGAYGFIVNEGSFDCFVEGCLSTNVREDLFSNNTRSSRYLGNVVRGNRHGSNTHGSFCVDILFQGNLIDACVFDGVTVSSASAKAYDKNISIVGNVIQNCGASGISVVGNATDNDGLLIADNTIIDCGTTSATQYGILVQKTNHFVVTGNVVRNPNTTNIVRSIYALTADDGEIGHNLITDAPTHGISVSACNRVSVHHNHLKTITNDVFRDEGSNVGCVACFNVADDVTGKLLVADVLTFGNQPAWGTGLDFSTLGLAISKASPQYAVDVEKTASDGVTGSARFTNLSDNAAASAQVIVKSGTTDAASGGIAAFHNSFTTAAFRDRVALLANSDADGLILIANGSGQDIRFLAGTGGELLRLSSNKIQTNQTAAGTVLGTVQAKLELFDLSGNSLGFVPLYDSIT